MNPHLADYVISAVLALGQAILAGVLLKRGAAKRWPYLLRICLFDIGYSALLFHYTGIENYKTYFYIFWVGMGTRHLLALGLLRDVIRAFPTLKYLPKRIGLTLFTFGTVVTLGAVLITTHQHPHTSYLITAQVLMIGQCVTIAWMCFAGTLLFSISILGLGWEREPMAIATGFVFSGLAAMITFTLMSSWPEHRHMIDVVQNCIEIAVLLFWSVSLCRNYVPDRAWSDSALNAVNELLEE